MFPLHDRDRTGHRYRHLPHQPRCCRSFSGSHGFFLALDSWRAGWAALAEIGSRYPVTGGYYKIFSYAYHPAVAFAINCSILISNAASVAGVALIGSEYILPVLFPEAGEGLLNTIAILAIAGFYGPNMLGLRISSRCSTCSCSSRSPCWQWSSGLVHSIHAQSGSHCLGRHR